MLRSFFIAFLIGYVIITVRKLWGKLCSKIVMHIMMKTLLPFVLVSVKFGSQRSFVWVRIS